MTAKVLQFPGHIQRGIADDTPETWDDHLPVIDGGSTASGSLASIVAAMTVEAMRDGESIRHLEHGCSMRLVVDGDRRRLRVWRATTDPSFVELRTLKTVFKIPYSVIPRWGMTGSQRVAILRWSVAPTRGEYFEDMDTIADIRELVERGEFREARLHSRRIYGRLSEMEVITVIDAAEKAAKEKQCH